MTIFVCMDCHASHLEDEVKSVGRWYCPDCGCEDLDERAIHVDPIAVMPVSTFGLEQLARKMKESA